MYFIYIYIDECGRQSHQFASAEEWEEFVKYFEKEGKSYRVIEKIPYYDEMGDLKCKPKWKIVNNELKKIDYNLGKEIRDVYTEQD
jgi:hypothetical protein